MDYCSRQKHYSFAYLHCTCSMNSAIGAGLKKKKKKKTAKMQNARGETRIQTLTKSQFE